MSAAIEYPDLVMAVSQALRAQDDTWDTSVVHASDLGYALEGERCPRQLWLRLRGADHREHTDGELLMFDRGTSLHERLTDLIRPHLPSGWTVEYVEHSIVEDEAARILGLVPEPVEDGRLDVELHGPGGIRIITDYKTTRGRAFQYIEERGPYLTHELQVNTYTMARDAAGGLLFYADREGQNFCKQFPVPRDDAAVLAAAARVQKIAQAEVPPPVMLPKLERRENKGPDSLYVNEPWQCQRCIFRERRKGRDRRKAPEPLNGKEDRRKGQDRRVHRSVFCPGALKPEHRKRRIVAKVDDAGQLLPQDGSDAEVLQILEELLWRERRPETPALKLLKEIFLGDDLNATESA